MPPRTVGLATASFGALLVFWSFLTPFNRAPDEMTHADLVFHLAEGADYPVYDGRPAIGSAAQGLSLYQGLQSGGKGLTKEAAPPRSERPTFAELGGDEPSAWVIRNQMPQHPPLYYEAAASLVRAERAVARGPWSFEREWYLVRLLGVILVLPLPYLSWRAARRLGAGDTAASAASIFPLMIPQLAHVGSAVGNGTPLILGGAALSVLLAGVLRGDASRRTGLLVGLFCGLALFTKAFGLFLLIWAGGVYATAWARTRARRRAYAGSALLALAVAFATGGWWWVSNLLRYGTATPSVETLILPKRNGFTPDAFWWTRRAAIWLPERFWGTFDWLTVPMDRLLLAVVTVLAAAAIAAAFVAPRARWLRPSDASIGRLRLAAYASLVPLLLAFIFQHAWTVYARAGLPQFLQGRYLFSAIVPLGCLVALGLARGLGRWTPTAVLVAATTMTANAWKVGLRAWWGPADSSVIESLRAVDAWNPVTDQAAWLALASVVVLFILLGSSVIRDARRQAVA